MRTRQKVKPNRRRNRRVVRSRRSPADLRKQVVRPLVLVLAVALAAGGLPVLGYYGYRQVVASGYFAPTDVRVEGSARTPQSEILAAAGVDSESLENGGVNLVDYDPLASARAIESLPWIRSAVVHASLPDRVRIEVEERTPAGVVLTDTLVVVDEEGEPIEPLSAAIERGALSADYGAGAPIVSGIDFDADFAVDHVRSAFSVANLYGTLGLERWAPLSEVHYDPALGYTLFAGETEVRLGRDRFADRLRRLHQVFTLLEQKQTYPEYVLLDLDDVDRVAVRPAPRVVEAEIAQALDEGQAD